MSRITGAEHQSIQVPAGGLWIAGVSMPDNDWTTEGGWNLQQNWLISLDI